ncbi:MAG: protein O-mannosyl-transferase family [Bacteroidia bacterium]
MLNYKKLNNITGWLVFLIATFTFVSTIEPTASFWDCGEYIACSYKLEVGHPPGAPFFLIIARFFSLFSFGDVSKAAYWVNVMSALCSSFTILFLYWTITRLATKIFTRAGEILSQGQVLAVLGSGIIGGLAYTFSDSFWFSAVEGEVYAMSSFFTAIVFWAILKWEEESEAASSTRWLILIAYLMGLSVGVHLLNLLVIPSICFIYYYKKHTFSWKGWFITGVISVILLGAVQSGIIPGIVKLAADYELLFVNKLGLPFNSGTLIYFILLIGTLIVGIMYSLNKKPLHFKLTIGLAGAFALFSLISGGSAGSIFMRLIILGGLVYGIYYLKNRHAAMNSIFMSFAVLLIGYSSFFILVIRSQANTPMDENDPENAITLLSYLNREQYGDWPIGYGNYYNSPLDRNNPYKDGSPVYTKDKKSGKYVITDDRKQSIPNYDPDFCTVFPRMWSTQSNHEAAYKYWGDVKGRAKQVPGRDGTPETIYLPTFGENMTYFIAYQIKYMYLRYFAWNFIGRQNDVQGLNDNPTEGNWITGIEGIDETRLDAKLSNLPSNVANNKATNKFYGLPFILGLLGIYFHFKRQGKDAFVVLSLFLLTGLAIVIYLNQYPYQPRERDYAYAASFYAYAIWIGLGVLAIYDFIAKKMNPKTAAILATAASFVVPGLMAAEGWDDHNRSKRTMSRDFAVNYLQSCAPNAILFTNGDNDTFPLWYAQEVEGIRTDVRVCNLSLLQTDWYINQMRRAAYDSKPVPFTLAPEKYVQGTRDVVYFMDKNVGYVSAKELMDFVASEDPNNKLNVGRDKPIEYFPSSKISIPVDSAKVVNNGTVSKDMAGRIVKNVQWEVKRQYLLKNDLMILDLLAGFKWDRPVYFAVTTGAEAYLNLEQYLQLEGLAYRLVPIKSDPKEMAQGVRVNAAAMYDNIMNKFQWGGMKTPGVYLDENCIRMASNMRIQMATLAGALIEQGKKDKAVKVLDKALEEMPEVNVPYDATMYSICLAYYQAGRSDKGNMIAEKLFDVFEKDMLFYNKLPGKHKAAYGREMRQTKEILMRLTTITAMFKQDALSKKFENRLPGVIPQEELNPQSQQVMP